MAKSAALTEAPDDRKWKVQSALDTLTRSYEIIKDKSLMADVKKLASTKAAEMSDIAGKADRLAKMGLISDKQRAKVGKK